ncbi:MAG: hypothetical protein WC371_03225 [Parachlamydiales bacterium]|jgi:SecD/SecF fusion protein
MQKRWQFFIILAVLALTLYNILPTVFYYSKPLKKPIGETEALAAGKSILNRVNSLEEASCDWLGAYLKELGQPALSLKSTDGAQLELTFDTIQKANLVKKYLPRAANLVPFAPAKFSLQKAADPKTILLKREIPLRFEAQKPQNYFHYASKFQINGQPTDFYRQIVFDRAANLASAGS